jgi:hypothetical protein
MVNPGNVISAYGLGDCTAEAPFDVAQDRLGTLSKEFLIKKYSELCELGVSVVNIPSQETRQNLIIESSFAVMTFPFTPSAPAAMRGSWWR